MTQTLSRKEGFSLLVVMGWNLIMIWSIINKIKRTIFFVVVLSTGTYSTMIGSTSLLDPLRKVPWTRGTPCRLCFHMAFSKSLLRSYTNIDELFKHLVCKNIIIRPHHSTMYVDAACCFRPGSVVCRSIYLLVYHIIEPCINGCTNRDAVWAEDSGGPKEPCTRWGSRSLHGKGQLGQGTMY